MRRFTLRAAACAVACSVAIPAIVAPARPAAARVPGEEPTPRTSARPFLVGVVESPDELEHPEVRQTVDQLRLDVVRVVLAYRPGLRPEDVRVGAPPGARVLLTATAPRALAPIAADDQDRYCHFLVDVLKLHPEVRDVAVWNEPGNVAAPSYFWPTVTGAGSMKSYAQLLARCYDAIHGAALAVNVVGPAAHLPIKVMRELIGAMRAEVVRRRAPVVDVFDVHPYNLTGQTNDLLRELNKQFARSAQRTPARGLKLWYSELGVQSGVRDDKRALYHGDENSFFGVKTEAEQAAYIRKSLLTAYCTPGVSGYFNFLLVDEENLGWENGASGWQSGLMYPDLTPKPALAAYAQAARAIHAGTVRCPLLSRSSRSTAGGRP